jgi:hypothetical protein
MSLAQRIEFVAETTSSLSMRAIAACYASGVEWASLLTATDATTLASSGRAWGFGATGANDAIAPGVATGTRVVASAIELKPSLRTARSREARLRRRPYTSPVPSQGMT